MYATAPSNGLRVAGEASCKAVNPPLNRDSFADAGERFNETRKRLAEFRSRLATAVGRIVGSYPVPPPTPGLQADVESVVRSLHNEIDAINEEVELVGAAVAALESALQ